MDFSYKNLMYQIDDSNSKLELENVIRSIPKEPNGFKGGLERKLLDCFWYFPQNDNQSFRRCKQWCIDVLTMMTLDRP